MLSLTADGKEGKSKVIVSCKFLEGSFKNHIEEKGVGLADSLETVGNKEGGSKGEDEEKDM